MNSSYFQIAESDGRLVGTAQIALKGNTAELSSLFVEPTRLRCGARRKLFEWAKRTARGAGAAHLLIEADPYAAGFYRRMGRSTPVPSLRVPYQAE